MGVSAQLSLHYCALGLVHDGLGDLEEAYADADEGLRLAKLHNELNLEAMASILLGGVLGKREPSQLHRATEHVMKGIEISDELRLRPESAKGHITLGELYANAGQNDKALEALKKAEAEFKDMGMDYWLKKAQDALARVQG
jgi:tetratricopeptide (TPR) repeat protein